MTSGIAAERGYGTPTKSRILAGGVHTRRQQIVRVDRGARHGELSRPMTARLLARLRPSAPDTSRASSSRTTGYGAGDPALVRARTSTRLTGKIVTVDSRGRVAAFRRIAGCTPNQEEVENALGLSRSPDDRGLVRAGRELLKKTGNGTVLVTRGAKGMILFRKSAPPSRHPAVRLGRGGRRHGRRRHRDRDLHARPARRRLTGRRRRSRQRRGRDRRHEVRHRHGESQGADCGAAQRGSRMSSAGKVVTRDELLRRAAGWRADGKTVAMANGLFDIVHVGHLRYLEEAATLGGRASSSRSTTTPPRAPSRARIVRSSRRTNARELVAGFRCVEVVTLFGEATVEPLLRALVPTVHCKGTDYTADTVPERETARQLGIRAGDHRRPGKRIATRDLISKNPRLTCIFLWRGRRPSAAPGITLFEPTGA